MVAVPRRFSHGVASADPSATSVVLWTRVDGLADGGPAVPVDWEVMADDPAATPLASGTAEARPDRDGTLQVRVDGLPPGTRLRYRFTLASAPPQHASGTTATLPAAGTAPAAPVRLVVLSCARHAGGHFHAYRVAAEARPTLVVHLGDYLYEDAGAGSAHGAVAGRDHDPPHRLLTLADYRRRYAQHRRDPHLQALHAAAPWVSLWDDHELANNAWAHGAEGHGPGDGDFGVRIGDATRAWHEWLPSDADHPGRGAGRLDRVLRIGDLAELVMVDTRLTGREEPADVTGAPTLRPTDDRRLLTPAQQAWLQGRVAEGTARWSVVANQVQVAPMHLAWVPGGRGAPGGGRLGHPVINPDQWDGYPAERDDLLAALEARGAGRALLVSGDLHGAFVNTVGRGRSRPGRAGGALATELTTPAVSAPTYAELVADRLPVPAGAVEPFLRAWLRLWNPAQRWTRLHRHGVLVLDLHHDRVEAVFRLLDDVTRPEAPRVHDIAWVVHHGDPVPRRRR